MGEDGGCYRVGVGHREHDGYTENMTGKLIGFLDVCARRAEYVGDAFTARLSAGATRPKTA
jgi:hypothetical protein